MREMVVLIWLLSLATTSCNDDRGLTATEDVAARVNDATIRISEVDRLIEQQLRSHEPGSPTPTPAELAMARLQVLDGLITQEALYQYAQRQGVAVTEEEVAQSIQKIKQERGLSEERFERMIKDAGQTEAQFREDVRRQLAVNKLYDRDVTPRITVTDREIEEFYAANRAQFVERRGFQLSQIMISAEVNNVPQDAVGAEAAERKIREIYDQLRSGADFATVAASRSEDPLTGPRGGGPTFVPENSPDLPPAFIQRLASMREGDFTEPIRAGNRWYIFKLNGRVARDRELTLDEVRPQIVKELQKQREEVLRAVVTQMALNETKVKNLMARRMLDNPTNFGNLRPISVPAPTQSTPQPTPPSQ
ncbi:MAG: SurA N-terminal domain-containing protein [Acidobacteria bacterium]|nr:SurA N-terminal domain-containing protein [Acidobacteriota bacterium]